MMILHNGQTTPTTGWFVDLHGHRMFLQRGQLVPICPHLGPVHTSWRLASEVAERQ